MARALQDRGHRGTAIAGLAVLGACVALAGCNGSSGDGASGATSVNADLVAVAITPVQSILEAGESVAVSVEVRNEGPEGVPGFRVGAYLSVDSTYDASDPRLATWTVGGLAAGGSFITGDNLQVPVATAAGEYRLLLFADDLGGLSEIRESNNVVATMAPVEIMEAQHPDLIVESVGFGPNSIQAGDTIDVDDVVRNIGVEASGSFRVGVYLSNDATISATDLLIGQRQIISLDPNMTETASGPITVPMFVTAGSYFVGVLADDLGAIVEMDETNNGLAANSTLAVSAAPLPDVAPVSITFSPATVDAGDPLTIDETVINQGLATAALFQVGVYLSDDPDIDPQTDTLLGTRAVTSLAVGSTSTSGPSPLTIPGMTPAGEYFVGVYADSGEALPETDEGNNDLLATGRVTVNVPPLADLAAQQFSFTPSAVQAGTGATVRITDDVANIGQAPSGTVRVAVYLSPDAAITPNDILLGFHELPGLGVGSASGRTIDLPVPGGISSGSYRVGLWVDDLDVEPELNEGNNLLVATSLLDVTESGIAAPNLVSELVDPAASAAEPGESFQVVTRVVNSGDASTTAFRVGVYLSTDTTISTADLRIGDRLVPFGLGAGFASVASAPVTIPATTAEGDYTIGMIADWQGIVAESNETDNALAAPGTFRVRIPPPPMPNLVVSTVDVIDQSPFMSGDVIDVDNTVDNTGDVDAGPFRVGIYLSDDETIDPAADTLLGSRIVSSLMVTMESRAVTAVQIPPGTVPGSWRIGVFVDDLDAIAENNEGDNFRVDPETFVVQ